MPPRQPAFAKEMLRRSVPEINAERHAVTGKSSQHHNLLALRVHAKGGHKVFRGENRAAPAMRNPYIFQRGMQ
jgi:hypothetical protein